jgi:hypothetical protein
VPLTIGAAVILGLELKPDPSLRGFSFLRPSVGAFFDSHDFLNNVAGFGVLAALTHFAFAGWNRDTGRRVLARAAVVGAIVILLECAQLLLPRRSCDWHDMVAGGVGILIASVPWLRGNRPSFGHDC